MRLARALELDQTAISRFENGSRRPSVELLKKIAAALGCPFAALVSEEYEGNGNLKNDPESKNDSDSEKNFVQALLAQNPEISVQLRSLADRSGELTAEDWRFLADHLKHAFGQVEMLLDRKNKK
ncbi:MAG: helix-turn-helix domain-containing protein [Synergistaceae bacterium]|nr:helix-turn-helix domain-containing protein [Synergistaceae bacterium]